MTSQELFDAVKENNTEAIEQILLTYPRTLNVNKQFQNGVTALHIAVRRNNLKAVNWLLAAGAQASFQDHIGNNILHWACRYHASMDIIKVLLIAGADAGSANDNCQTPLFYASSWGYCEAIVPLINHGACVRASDMEGFTPLHVTCQGIDNRIKMAYILIENGADIEAKDNDGSTPLDVAVVNRNAKVVELLLDNGADMTATDKEGHSPFHKACRHQTVDVLRLFLDRGVDVEVKDGEGETAIFWACEDDSYFDILQELVSRGADWTFMSPYSGKSPFQIAEENGCDRISQFLQRLYLDHLAQVEGHHLLHSILSDGTYSTTVEEENDTSDGDSMHETTKAVSILLGNLSVDRFLTLLASILSTDPGAVCRQDKNGCLPLHIACCSPAHLEIVQFLTSQDVGTLHTTNNNGCLPIHAACATGSVPLEVIKHLLEVGGSQLTLSARNHEGALPMHLLCKSEPSLAVVKFLMQSYSSSLLVKTNGGDLPIMLAANHNASVDVVFELLKAYPDALSQMKTPSNS